MHAIMSIPGLLIVCLGLGIGVRGTEDQQQQQDSRPSLEGTNTNEAQGKVFLDRNEQDASLQCYQQVVASWNYATNLTEANKQKLIDTSLKAAELQKKWWKEATSFAWKGFKQPLVKRAFKKLSILGSAALDPQDLHELESLEAELKDIYSTAHVCPLTEEDCCPDENDPRCTLALDPDLTRIFSKSRDYRELAYYWKAYRDATGKKMRSKYLRHVELMNKAARLNGFADAGASWREPFEAETFLSDIEKLWDQLRPLYENLHAYIRHKLVDKYGVDKVFPLGPIPAHLLGNIWSQAWSDLGDFTAPFQGKPTIDVTENMVAKKMTATDIFKVSEEFFTSLGLKPMVPAFWNDSVIVKPKDRNIVCHASAWDFCNGRDYRIKQCTEINQRDLVVTHHEMGHIQYFMQYAHQPLVFREGANPGFHEAIGDVLALSVSTPKHLQKIGLLHDVTDDYEAEINFLFKIALDKMAFLPFAYLVDLWRWNVFSGKTKPEELNTKWWELRLQYQGICPPVQRTEEDFDPGSKYHIPASVPYIRYFVSHVVQYQFHKALCQKAGHNGPLHTCDIYNSKAAGDLFSKVLSLGSSVPWQEAMQVITEGKTDRMDARPMMEYFAPLTEWLQEQNVGKPVGWSSSDPTICP